MELYAYYAAQGWRIQYNSNSYWYCRAYLSDGKSAFTIDTRISYFSAEIETTDDSGIVGDNVTNNTRPTFTGKTEPNAIISVINSETGEEVIFKANDKGEWTFNFTSDSVEGVNNLTFTVEDVAGNKKDFSFSYIIDTVALYLRQFLWRILLFYRMV